MIIFIEHNLYLNVDASNDQQMICKPQSLNTQMIYGKIDNSLFVGISP